MNPVDGEASVDRGGDGYRNRFSISKQKKIFFNGVRSISTENYNLVMTDKI